MGVYAHGEILYGFVHTDETETLFEELEQTRPEREQGNPLEEMDWNLQQRHHVFLSRAGYEGIDIIAAYSKGAASKGFAVQSIEEEDLARTGEYKDRIAAFLTELGINPSKYIPKWYLLGYIN